MTVIIAIFVFVDGWKVSGAFLSPSVPILKQANLRKSRVAKQMNWNVVLRITREFFTPKAIETISMIINDLKVYHKWVSNDPSEKYFPY